MQSARASPRLERGGHSAVMRCPPFIQQWTGLAELARGNVIEWVRQLKGSISVRAGEIALLVAYIGDDRDVKHLFDGCAGAGFIICNASVVIGTKKKVIVEHIGVAGS